MAGYAKVLANRSELVLITLSGSITYGESFGSSTPNLFLIHSLVMTAKVGMRNSKKTLDEIRAEKMSLGTLREKVKSGQFRDNDERVAFTKVLARWEAKQR